MKLVAYSKALFSNWIYLESARLLLDVGEGVNNILESRLLGIRDLCITHGHTDHFTGLQSLIGIRAREVLQHGQELPRLHVYYPNNSRSLDRYLTYLQDSIAEWDDLVMLHPVRPGQSFALQSHEEMVVTPFEMYHIPDQLCLGYRISQKRSKLRPEFHALSQDEIRDIAREQGRDALNMQVEVPLMTYSGDGKPMQDPGSQGVSLLMHEATFIDPDSSYVHTTLSEAIELFRELEAGKLLLWHLSVRYEHEQILQAIDERVPDPEERARIDVILPGEIKECALEGVGL